MKTEIEIPPQYAEILKKQAAEQDTTANEIVENAIRKYMEGGETDAVE